MHSLSRRLLVSVSVPLALFFGVMMVVLDTGFRELSERSVQEVLDRQMVALIAAAEPQPNGGYAPAPHTLDPRLRDTALGAVRTDPLAVARVALALDGGTESRLRRPAVARATQHRAMPPFGHDRVAIESRAIQFEDDPNGARALTFSVAVSLSPYEQQLWRFRQQLVGWFIGLMLLLLVTLAALLRWVLAPVRRMEREIHEVEEGRSETLGSRLPARAGGVATNLNALLVGERKRVARYRDTLGNLAHSLKTPLAVMRSA